MSVDAGEGLTAPRPFSSREAEMERARTAGALSLKIVLAMAIKELRENWGIGLVALIAYAYLVSALIYRAVVPMPRNWLPNSAYPIPLVNDGFAGYFCLISAVLALALGLRQTVGEGVAGTYPFLLHRAAARPALMSLKLLVGLVIYAVCAALPIVVYAAWAARPDSHPGPFDWSMTLAAWEYAFQVGLVYLAAFLAGLRPGRWFGSRLLPTLAIIPLYVVANGLPLELGWRIPLFLLADAWMIVTTLFIARSRDY